MASKLGYKWKWCILRYIWAQFALVFKLYVQLLGPDSKSPWNCLSKTLSEKTNTKIKSGAKRGFVSGFFKHFQNPIEQIVANGSVPSNLILTYSNPKQAINYGVELEYRKSLSRSLSLYTNMSLIKSQVEVNGVVRPLQGQSPYIINTGLYYQHKNISVSFLYNRIGERITAVGFNGYSDIYENSRDLLDATIQYRTNKIEFKLSFTDILSQPTVLYQKTNGDLINTINEKTISISLNYKLWKNYYLWQ